jgi:hypothetical protein
VGAEFTTAGVELPPQPAKITESNKIEIVLTIFKSSLFKLLIDNILI